MTGRLLTTRDAMLGIVVGAIHADGRVVDPEVREAQLRAQGIPSLAIEPAEVVARLPDVKRALAQQGESAFVDACIASMTLDLRVRAFHAATEVVAADGEVVALEERYLARLATAMQVAAMAAPAPAGI